MTENFMVISLKHAIFLNVHNNFDYASFEKYLEGLNLILKDVYMDVAEGLFSCGKVIRVLFW